MTMEPMNTEQLKTLTEELWEGEGHASSALAIVRFGRALSHAEEEALRLGFLTGGGAMYAAVVGGTKEETDHVQSDTH